ncbi:phosphonate C-P lyase system protein PhnG [Halovulum sp. GXIMD14793]
MSDARRDWLSVLARADAGRMTAALADHPVETADWPRPAEIGMIMLEGRAGGTGQRFSMSQATVTRATCRLSGQVGVGYVLGHDPARAEAMALCDALLQAGDTHLSGFVAQEAARQSAARQDAAKAAASTKVDFFAMERNSSAGAA